MHRIDSTLSSLPLFTVASTRQIEARAQAALPRHALMQRAGEAAARLALALAPHARRVWIAAGPGNNGGDGLEAALCLARSGHEVGVWLIGEPADQPPDARAALERAREAGVAIDTPVGQLRPGDIAIDALLGIGASRPPAGPLAEAIRQLNALACPVLAIDVPSGLDADTGRAFTASGRHPANSSTDASPIGSAHWSGNTEASATATATATANANANAGRGASAVIAQHTLALLSLNPGLFTGSGRDHAGTVWLDLLGVASDDRLADAMLVGSGASASSRTKRRYDAHKGSFGDLAVVGGAAGMVGAALLAARAGHAAGAGRVYVALLTDGASAPDHDPMRPELMFRRGWAAEASVSLLAATTVVCGCGGGDAVRGVLPRLLGSVARLVLDADALNAIADDSALATLLQRRAARGLHTVLTPHPLEAARLLGCTAPRVQADRLLSARELADRYAAVIVLKGSGSVVSAPNRTSAVAASGNAALATAGTGDVLAGWLGGLWAQANGDAHPFDVAVRAAVEHGAAAEPYAPGPLRADDLIEALYRRLRSGR